MAENGFLGEKEEGVFLILNATHDREGAPEIDAFPEGFGNKIEEKTKKKQGQKEFEATIG